MRREPPQIRWNAVLIGGAVAVLASVALAIPAFLLGSDPLLTASTPVGLAAGGLAAGRISGHFGALQGGMVGVLWVLAEALAGTFGTPSGDVLGEVALIILADGGRIGLAALLGWIGERWALRSTPSS